jgi:plasmid maintenance system antidote protein VapI
VRLAHFFGNDAEFWMHLQVAWDMHAAVRRWRATARS